VAHFEFDMLPPQFGSIPEASAAAFACLVGVISGSLFVFRRGRK